MARTPKKKPELVDVGTLAKLFQITAVRVQQLAADGVVVKVARGQYDREKSVAGYVHYLQTKKANQHSAGMGADKDAGDIDAERLRKTTEEADKLAIANARSRGELVEIAAVTRLGQNVLIAVRNRILNMPLTDDEKDSCLRELLELKNMDWSRPA